MIEHKTIFVFIILNLITSTESDNLKLMKEKR